MRLVLNTTSGVVAAASAGLRKSILPALVAAAAAVTAAPSFAAVVTFDDFTSISDDSVFPTDLAVRISDTDGGVDITFSSTQNGSVLAAYFELMDSITVTEGQLSIDPELFATDTTGFARTAADINPNTFVYDFAFGYTPPADIDFGSTISITNDLLDATDFTRVALRLQDTGENGEGSAKIYSENPEVIPLPAAAWLLMGGFGALGALRASRRKA